MNLFQAVRMARFFSIVHPELRQLRLFSYSTGPCWYAGLEMELQGLEPSAGVQSLLAFIRPLKETEWQQSKATYSHWGRKLAELEKADRLQLVDIMANELGNLHQQQ
jgi:hypothetical protein